MSCRSFLQRRKRRRHWLVKTQAVIARHNGHVRWLSGSGNSGSRVLDHLCLSAFVSDDDRRGLFFPEVPYEPSDASVSARRRAGSYGSLSRRCVERREGGHSHLDWPDDVSHRADNSPALSRKPILGFDGSGSCSIRAFAGSLVTYSLTSAFNQRTLSVPLPA